jgi:hypothetical protein
MPALWPWTPIGWLAPHHDNRCRLLVAWNLLQMHNANNPDIAYGIKVWLGMARILNSWTGSDGGIA